MIAHAPLTERESAPDLHCDQPNCPRALIPFENVRQRKSHRFAAHAIRTEREDSIARRERRVRSGIIEEVEDDLAGRTDVAEAQAEIMIGSLATVLARRGILLVAPQLQNTPPPPHPTIRPRLPIDRRGALPRDELEHVRRRMVHTVTVLAVELQRFPIDVLNAATDACHRRLYPRGIHAVCVDPEEGYGSAATSDKRGRREH